MKQTSPQALRLLHDGSQVFSRMSSNGIRINKQYLDESFMLTQDRIDELASKMKVDEDFKTLHRRYGGNTDINSRNQMKTLAYEMLGHVPTVFSEKGEASSSADAFEELGVPLFKLFGERERCKTTINTFLNGIRKEIVKHGNDYYVHPSFNLHTASTYRSSANSPNVHNAPKRNPEMASFIRPCYMAHPGYYLVEVDLSGAEVRAAACYNHDPVLIMYIKDPTTDMHRDMAMDLFILKQEEVWKRTTRDSSKNQFVFPEFYGSIYYNCAKNIWKAMKKRDFRVGEKGITIREHLAKKGIKELGACDPDQEPRKGTFEYHVRSVERKMWQQRFKTYTQWKDKWRNQYYQTAEMEFLSGFVIKNVLLSRADLIDYPIQGFAFHWLLWSIIQIQKWLTKNKMKTKLINEIHDSLVASVWPSELQDFLGKCKEVFTVDLPKHWESIIVPVEIEVEVAEVDSNWFQCKKWSEKNGVWRLAA
jgi:DNA polymerase-1